MKDKQDREMEVGDAIVYATSRGSTVYLEDAVVQRVFPDEDKVKVGKFSKWYSDRPGPYHGWNISQTSVYLRTPDRIIILGEDNAEDSADRALGGPRP